ncbi:hypothetical protein KCU90_g15987, partial [Aureobasidium melanogenum]
MPYYDYVDDKRTFQRGIFSFFALVLAGLCIANPGGIFRSEKKYEPPSPSRQWPRNRRSLSESDSSSSNSSSQSSLDEPLHPRRAHHHTSSRDGMRARYPYPPDQDYALHTHHHHSHHQRHNSPQSTLSRADDPFAWENTLKGL